MTNDQFLQLNGSINTINVTIETIQTSIGKINQTMEVFSNALELTNKSLLKLSDKIDRLDVKFTGEIGRLDSKFGNLHTRLTSLEMDFRDFFVMVAKRFDSVENRLENLETNQDHFLKEIHNLNEEKIIADYRQGLMEEWVIKAGQKIDLPYQR